MEALEARGKKSPRDDRHFVTVFVTARMKRARAKEVPAKEHADNPIFEEAKSKEIGG